MCKGSRGEPDKLGSFGRPGNSFIAKQVFFPYVSVLYLVRAKQVSVFRYFRSAHNSKIFYGSKLSPMYLFREIENLRDGTRLLNKLSRYLLISFTICSDASVSFRKEVTTFYFQGLNIF